MTDVANVNVVGMVIQTDPEIKVVLDDGALIPVRAHATDAGADIFTPVDFTVGAHDSAIVHTGVHVETPAHCVTMIKSKSGLNVKNDITSEGVVDEGYTGEVVVKLYNHGDTAFHFERGMKISQLCVLPVIYPTYIEADELADSARGSAGFGSTGA